MKCRHLFSFALVACLSFFFGFFITINDTFAVNDISYTLQSGFDDYLCSNVLSQYPNCSDFDYLIISPNSSLDSFFRVSSQGVILRVPTFMNSIYFINNISDFRINTLSDVDSVAVTLTNSLPSSSSPSGNLDITSNGTYDVSSYATATVDVPAEVVQGDYHDDLVNIQNAIITCGAILLVLYFFYCIYRLIIKNSGVH